MERKIGEIFDFLDEWYQCVEMTGCQECDLSVLCLCRRVILDNIGYCSSRNRSDGKSIIFKKLEKVGEPYSCNYYGDNRLIMMQEYNLYNLDDVTNEDKIPMYITDYKRKRIAIEIKQIKQNMEEKNEYIEETSARIAEGFKKEIEKHFKEYMDKIDTSKLKTFDIQKAREGKPVCTRDGRKARIIAFDKKGFRAIVGLVDDGDKETLMLYDEAGRSIGDVSEFDLMMLPEKKEGWVNVYKSRIYDTEEEAIAKKIDDPNYGYIETRKIEWEE